MYCTLYSKFSNFLLNYAINKYRSLKAQKVTKKWNQPFVLCLELKWHSSSMFYLDLLKSIVFSSSFPWRNQHKISLGVLGQKNEIWNFFCQFTSYKIFISSFVQKLKIIFKQIRIVLLWWRIGHDQAVHSFLTTTKLGFHKQFIHNVHLPMWGATV